MDPVSNGRSRDKVLGMKDLVAEIMLKVGSSRSMVRCGAVNRTWSAARKDEFFVRRFAESRAPAFLGFLVDFRQLADPSSKVLRLLYPLPSAGEESAVAIRPFVDLEVLAGDNVLSSWDGIVLTAGHGFGENQHIYYTSSISKQPRVYNAAAPQVPRIPMNPGQLSKNTFGQFAVLPGADPSGQSLFIKDAAEFPFCTYDGVSFCSKEDIFVHVCVFNNGSWVRHISEPFPTNTVPLFHRNPYSVIHGDTLYMMYLVGFIVTFDLTSYKFSTISLPSTVRDNVRSWYDYTVCNHSEGGVAIVHYTRGRLDTWVLVCSSEPSSWKLESTVDLVPVFPLISKGIWKRIFSREASPLGADNFFTVQVRCANPEAQFVMLTLGFDPNFHMVDMLRSSVGEIIKAGTDGLIGHIFPLSEQWPV